MPDCEQENTTLHNQSTGENLFILASAVILAIVFDVLINRPFVALSYPVFIVILLLFIYKNTWNSLSRKLNTGWFLLVPLLALALTKFLFANEIFSVLNSVLVPVLFIAHILLVTNHNRHEWFCFGFLKDICRGLIIRPLQYITKPVFLVFGLSRLQGEGGRLTVFRKALVGIILSVPLLIVVVVLLSSADQVFNRLIGSVLNNISFGELAQHSIVLVLITLLAFSFIWSLTDNKVDPVSCQAGTKKLDEIIVISVLCVMSAVYIMFSAIQFSYLFGSFSSQLPFGLSYADYARSGFWELVAVSLINTVLVVGNINFTATASQRTEIVLKSLNSVMLLSTFVMLFSAHYRMSMYEESFGYTYLRVFTHSFMFMLFIMLCTTVYKVWSGRINLAKCYIAIGLTAYVLINYVNVDTFIAEKNMVRYYKTGKIDPYYMTDLSYDALPYWLELTKAGGPGLSANVNETLTYKISQLLVDKSWQGFNLAEERAKKALRIYR